MSEPDRLQPLSDSQREMLEEATAAYAGTVLGPGLAWLDARGIDPATAVDFRLGYVSQPLPGHERYVNHIAIPYLGHDGRVLSMRFRCARGDDCKAEKHAKYMSMPGDPARIYNVRALHTAGAEIAISEGEFDAVILNKVGIPAVGFPGATSWRPHHRKVFAGFDRVWIFGDPDEAGGELVNKITRSLPQARALRLAADVTDTYVAQGADALLSLVTERKVA